jgi:hypothetical protein|tara:strand:+ start:160 stop:291 length:132 start_codon:yes stop_codon:yes gene_type:complete
MQQYEVTLKLIVKADSEGEAIDRFWEDVVEDKAFLDVEVERKP